MIGGAKSMIAGCIDRMGRNDCDGCERRDACAQLFSGPFGQGASARSWTPRRRTPPRSAWGNAFLSILGEVAKSVERNVQARQDDAAGKPAEAPPRAAKPRAASAFAKASADKPAAAAAPQQAGPGPFREEVERHLEPLLAAGPIGIDSVARALGYSRQTLYRRLKAEGVTFEQVLDGLRRNLALRFIREEGLPVKEAAYRLGFSDPAAFSRAFKRWTGASPGKK
jgi:AraC-like DNA-binding protein